MSTTQGSFVWYDLATSDLDAAKAFYTKVAGWTLVDSGMPGAGYWLAKIGERPVAGLMKPPPEAQGMPNMWFGYIHVDDVDAMAARVRETGGAVHRDPTDIPGVGRFAVVADPQGATFMLFRGNGVPMDDLPANTQGDVGWRELRASDGERAFAWYQGLFGWEKSYAHDMGPMGLYQTFSVGGAWTGGVMTAKDAPHPHWTYYINVADIDAAAARIGEAGGKILNGPHAVPGGNWVVMGVDSTGAPFALTGAKKQ